jgi:hypothetical protein
MRLTVPKDVASRLKSYALMIIGSGGKNPYYKEYPTQRWPAYAYGEIAAEEYAYFFPKEGSSIEELTAYVSILDTMWPCAKN